MSGIFVLSFLRFVFASLFVSCETLRELIVYGGLWDGAFRGDG